jgi:hypothetical protein
VDKSKSRRQWEPRARVTEAEVTDARNKMNLIKKTVIDKETDLATHKLQSLNKSLEREREVDMENKRKERMQRQREM